MRRRARIDRNQPLIIGLTEPMRLSVISSTRTPGIALVVIVLSASGKTYFGSIRIKAKQVTPA
jgi:hypothetical protein